MYLKDKQWQLKENQSMMDKTCLEGHLLRVFNAVLQMPYLQYYSQNSTVDYPEIFHQCRKHLPADWNAGFVGQQNKARVNLLCKMKVYNKRPVHFKKIRREIMFKRLNAMPNHKGILFGEKFYVIAQRFKIHDFFPANFYKGLFLPYKKMIGQNNTIFNLFFR